MRRTSLVVGLLAPLAAGTAQAQVALTEMAPAAPRYFESGFLGFNSATVTADNPAAQQWGEPGRLAFGSIELEEENAGGGTTDYSGYFGGYRAVTGGWALGLEHVTVKEDGGDFDETATSGHLSFKLLEGLALGAGLDLARADRGPVTTELEANTFGLSVGVQNTFYIGYALGREKFEDSAGNTGGRDTTLIGFAIRTKGAWRWHLAYDALDKDNFDSTGGSGFDATTITVQLGSGNFLFGAQQVEIDDKGGGTRFEANVFDFGWAPERGLNLTARISDGKNVAGGANLPRDSTSLIVSYLY